MHVYGFAGSWILNLPLNIPSSMLIFSHISGILTSY